MATIKATPSVLWYYLGEQLNYIAFAATMEENHTGQATVSKYPVQKGFEVSNHMIRHNKRIQIRAYIPETIMGGLDLEGADAGFTIGAMANKYLGVDLVNVSTIIGGVVTDPTGVASNYLEGAVSALKPKVDAITNVVDGVASKIDSWFGTDVSSYTDKVTGISDKFTATNSRRVDAFNKIQTLQDKGIICSLGTALKDYNDLVLVDYNIPTNIDTMSIMYVDLVFEQILVVDEQGKLDTIISVQDVNSAEAQDAVDRTEKFFDSDAANFVRDKTEQAKDYIGNMFA